MTSDLQQFSKVLHAALSVPVHGDASPFIIPSYPEVTITPLQEASLHAMDALVKVSPVPSPQSPCSGLASEVFLATRPDQTSSDNNNNNNNNNELE